MQEQTVGFKNARRSILKKSGTKSPRVHLELKNTKTTEGFFNIREQLGPSLGVAQGGAQHHRADREPSNTSWAEDGARNAALQWDRNHNASVYEERDPNWTEYCEEHGRKAAWTRATELYKHCGNLPREQ